jgi:hypothetical protein
VTVAASPGLAAGALLDLLAPHVPGSAPSVPANSVILARVEEAPVGLGRFIGEETVGELGRVAHRAGRISATVRFDVWAGSPGDAHDGLRALQIALLDAEPTLRAAGVLRLTPEPALPSHSVEPEAAWRVSADYQVLYEFLFRDADAGDSLITRIPVDAELDVATTAEPDHETVRGSLVRWDDEAAPVLQVRGPAVVTATSALVFLTAVSPTGALTVRRSSDRAVVPPDGFVSLTQFLDAVAGPTPASTNAEVEFSSLGGFLASLTPVPGTIGMGDWNSDGAPDTYAASTVTFPVPIVLPTHGDRMEIAFASPALDQPGVVYLRLDQSGQRGIQP